MVVVTIGRLDMWLRRSRAAGSRAAVVMVGRV
jgi:hypothetical protein